MIPINFDDDDGPADTIIRQTAGSRGVDAVIATLKLEGSSCKAL